MKPQNALDSFLPTNDEPTQPATPSAMRPEIPPPAPTTPATFPNHRIDMPNIPIVWDDSELEPVRRPPAGSAAAAVAAVAAVAGVLWVLLAVLYELFSR